MKRSLPCALALCLIATWAAAVHTHGESARVFEFPSTGVTFDADFEGARLNDCTLQDNGDYLALILPENEPINDSAWYAFRVSAERAQSIVIHLTYEGGEHRYHPKISTNGADWTRLPQASYEQADGRARLLVDAGPEPLWIAGQELIGVRELNAWIDQMDKLPFIETEEIGRSIGGRPIRKLTIRQGEPDHAIFIIGRQHPPELTGTFALTNFVETIAGSGNLAGRFRERFETTVVPLVNPDGVAAGHWRHNLNGVDLNRDWERFRQPETRAVRDEILEYQSDATPRLAFFLDFHSTQQDIFYVESGDEAVWPVNFPARWLNALSEQLPDYRVKQEVSTEFRPYSKDWVRRTMRCPAVIYEMGDETDRDLIRRVAIAAAEEMMRLLIEEVGE